MRQALQKLQHQLANAGWRIKLIPHDDPAKPASTETSWIGLFGAAVFIGGMAGYVWQRELFYIIGGIGGLVTAALGLLFENRRKRSQWIRIEAMCTDREIRECHTGDGKTWAFRLICQFRLAGKEYAVTPAFWKSFGSKKSLEKFLAKVIDDNGTCELDVNPANPLQTELRDLGFRDLLLGR